MTGEAALAGQIDTAAASGNRYAGFWRRLAAGLIDGLMVSIIIAIALLALDLALADGMEVTGALHALAALAGAAAVVSCLAVAFTAHKQGLHDRMARAYLIRD